MEVEVPTDESSFDPTAPLLGPTFLTPPTYKAIWRSSWDTEFLVISYRTIRYSRIASLPFIGFLAWQLIFAQSAKSAISGAMATLLLASMAWYPMYWAAFGARTRTWMSFGRRESHPHVLLFITWIFLSAPALLFIKTAVFG